MHTFSLLTVLAGHVFVTDTGLTREDCARAIAAASVETATYVCEVEKPNVRLFYRDIPRAAPVTNAAAVWGVLDAPSYERAARPAKRRKGTKPTQ